MASAIAAFLSAFLAGGASLGLARSAPRFYEQDRAKEYELKAAFLYHFAKYTTWPEGCFATEESPLVIAVVGKDPFGAHLDALAGKKVAAHPIRIKRLADPEVVEGVHILFLGELEDEARTKLLERCAERPLLVVGDEKELAEKGAQIAFYLEEAKLRFAVSTKAVERARLALGSQLLKLADIVEKRKGGQ